MIRQILFAFLAFVAFVCGGSLADERRPNIVLIVSDDESYDGARNHASKFQKWRQEMAASEPRGPFRHY